jgi:DNA-directed RNA polymerase subunit RPC12/RpoP
MTKEFNREQLIKIADSEKTRHACPECSSLSCAGWESVPSAFDLKKLNIIGTLKVEGAEECWDEYHPNDTNIWSENAPISIKHHPYNRCDVYECIGCKKKFLRYTEYGGYYVDERIRELNPKLIA